MAYECRYICQGPRGLLRHLVATWYHIAIVLVSEEDVRESGVHIALLALRRLHG